MMLRVVAVAAVAACNTADTAPKAVDRCSPAALKLPNATPLNAWKPPDGCEATGEPGKRVLRTQADVDANLTCAKGKTHGVDLAKKSLVKVTWNMSPAAVGLDALDDGKTITLVTRSRNPCPDDPHPMPITLTEWFVMPAGGADRAFAAASCTIDSKCK
jgi:hypothetical protein